MGRIEKMKRLLIEEANKRILNEQEKYVGGPEYNELMTAFKNLDTKGYFVIIELKKHDKHQKSYYVGTAKHEHKIERYGKELSLFEFELAGSIRDGEVSQSLITKENYTMNSEVFSFGLEKTNQVIMAKKELEKKADYFEKVLNYVINKEKKEKEEKEKEEEAGENKTKTKREKKVRK